MKHEAAFSAKLRKNIKDWSEGKIHQYLIQDSYRSGKKPYDFYLVRDGKFVSLELKHEKQESIRLDRFSPQQVIAAKEVWASGGTPLFVIGFDIKPVPYVGVMKLADYQKAVKELGDDKSIKASKLLELGLMRRIDLIKATASRALVWDVKSLLRI